VEGPCEYDNETSGTIECWEVFEKLLDWWAHENGSAPLS
jgi:hypothetical protein